MKKILKVLFVSTLAAGCCALAAKLLKSPKEETDEDANAEEKPDTDETEDAAPTA